MVNNIKDKLNINHYGGNNMSRLPVECPSCRGVLAVRKLGCRSCGTEVEGAYPLPILATLPMKDAAFALEFIKSSGSLKQMAKHLGVSYPTVRNRLDDMIAKLTTDTIEEEGANDGR
jgi:hypothetical protein